MNQIGTLNEKPLHAALKEWYAGPSARFEQRVDGYVIDLVQDDSLIEIQTRGFSGLKRKLGCLVKAYPVCLVHPIAREKWIVKLSEDGQQEEKRRKSPKLGSVLDIFHELVSLPTLLSEPNFSLEVLLIQEEEVRRFVGRQAWRRRGWKTEERRLIKVVERHRFDAPSDLSTLLPANLPDCFTTTDLAKKLAISSALARKMAYCLRKMGMIQELGKRSRSRLYQQTV